MPSITTKFKTFMIALLIGIITLTGGVNIALAQEISLRPLKDKADDLLYNYQVLPALELYQEIISRDPDFANCYYNMAICYKELKQFDKAYESLAKFVRLKPSDSEAYFNMGIMQVYLGNDANARELLLKARALHPSKDIKKRIQDALDHLEPNLFPEDSLAEIQAYLSELQTV